MTQGPRGGGGGRDTCAKLLPPGHDLEQTQQRRTTEVFTQTCIKNLKHDTTPNSKIFKFASIGFSPAVAYPQRPLNFSNLTRQTFQNQLNLFHKVLLNRELIKTFWGRPDMGNKPSPPAVYYIQRWPDLFFS